MGVRGLVSSFASEGVITHATNKGIMNISKKKLKNRIYTDKISRFSSLSIDFSSETIQSIHRLGSVLQRIHSRMIQEGYAIVDGKIQKI